MPDITKDEAYDLEAVYDHELAPLMAEVIAICQKHELPFFASFQYGSDGDGDRSFCTSGILRRYCPELKAACEIVRPTAQIVALTIHTAEPKS